MEPEIIEKLKRHRGYLDGRIRPYPNDPTVWIAETTYLILPDEEFDLQTHQVKERGIYRQPDESAKEVLS